MEAKVPQRIDMEDRLIGPLTLQQFFYVLFGGLFIYLLNSWTADSVLRVFFWPIAIVVGVLSFCLAFIKVQDRPFLVFLGAMVRYLERPRQRIWQKRTEPSQVQIVRKSEAPKAEAPHKTFNRQRVTDVVKVVDTERSNG